MSNPDYSISTPENVDLHLELAGLGNRILACLVDSAVALAAILLIVAILALTNVLIGLSSIDSKVQVALTGVIAMVGLLAAFFISIGYYIVFEGMWQGQTPGKRLVHIRVIDKNGQPAGWAAIFIRNLIRVLDQYLMMVGVICMIVDKSERRFGDLAAGTLVIRERLSEFSTADIALEFPVNQHDTLDVGRVTPQEYDLLVSYLRRRTKLSPDQKPVIAKQLEEHFRNKLSEPNLQEQNPDAFLERVFSLYQDRANH